MENTVSVQAIMAQVDMIKTKFASSMEEYKNNIDYAYTNVGVTSANIDSIVADIKGEVERLKTRFDEVRMDIEKSLTESAEGASSDIQNIEKELGKPIGSDSSNEKNTFAVRCGIQEAQKFAEKLTDDAMNALYDFDDSCFLKELSAYLMKRNK